MMAMTKFAYASATSVEEAIQALGEMSRPLAGGTDLIPMLKEGLAAPDQLIDIKRLPGLVDAALEERNIRMGALMPLHKVGPFAREQGLPILAEAIAATGSPQIRHMATLGGNLLQRPRCWYFRNKLTFCLRKGGQRCFAFRGENKYHAILGGGPCFIVHPSDPATALMALDAFVVVQGPHGERTLPLTEFYLLPKQDPHREVDLADDELVTQILIPRPGEDARGAFVKVSERQTWDFALVSAAVQLTFEGDEIRRARVALGGVAPIPWRAIAAEDILERRQLAPETIAQAAQAATEGNRPLAQNEYKIRLVQGVVKEALERFL